MEFIGTVGAIVGIIDVATRSICALSNIRWRFKEVNFSLDLLTGQLCAVRTALDQVQRFMNEELLGFESHYQLVLDLDVSLSCCKRLVDFLHEHIQKLEHNDDDSLTFMSKVQTMLQNQGMQECLTHLDRQIGALNLVLTAFKW